MQDLKQKIYGMETISYLGLMIWNLLPNYMKEISNFQICKKEIKSWIPQNCPCKLCKPYVAGIGYLNIVMQVDIFFFSFLIFAYFVT